MSAPKVCSALSGRSLQEALQRVGRTNDMLPPREDDKVAGRIPKRFVEALGASVSEGTYEPAAASFVYVPKTRFATRPAALLTLADRVVFEALVQPMREKIEAFLVSDEVVFWPRGIVTEKRWDEFEAAPLEAGGGHVVVADVAGFYESVDHAQLRRDLVRAGVSVADAEALEEFLHSVMRSTKGVPQGIATSDPLATVYLAASDAAVRRTGAGYWRHGDDIRMAATNFAEARRLINTLEAGLRGSGLLLNAAKLRVFKFATYSDLQTDLAKARDSFRARLLDARKEAIRNSEEPERLEELMTEAGIDEDMQWGFWYHGNINIDEVLEALHEHIAPSVLEVQREMFRDAMRRRPGSPNGLGRELWHARVAYCLRRFAAARSDTALPYTADLLVRFPEETQFVANYLLSLVDDEPARVAQAVEHGLANSEFLLGWQRGWLYRVLARVASHVGEGTLAEADRVMRSQDEDWLARIEAARLLGIRARLSADDVNSLHRNAPEAFRTDLFAIAAELEPSAAWARAFLDGARQDALHGVVIDAVRAKQAQQGANSP